jgi:hypothetical protein
MKLPLALLGIAVSTLLPLAARASSHHHRPSPTPNPTAAPSPTATPSPTPNSTPATGTYSTSFPLMENPISENGNWINGGVQGLSWTNVRTTGGSAVGTMPGNASGNAQYADSTAVLTGNWGPNQTVQGTIAVTSASGASGVFEEVELRVRTTITAYSIKGYEINCSVSTNPNNYYLQIVRWNGPINNWTQLAGTELHGVNGSVLKATISGNTITAYLNGAQVLQVNDNTYTSGSPGIGFFLQGATGLNANYGFSSFSASAQ